MGFNLFGSSYHSLCFRFPALAQIGTPGAFARPGTDFGHQPGTIHIAGGRRMVQTPHLVGLSALPRLSQARYRTVCFARQGCFLETKPGFRRFGRVGTMRRWYAES